jgi:hypothetical protein
LPTEGVRLVGQSHVQRIAVEIGVHGNRRDPEFAAGPNDTNGDLAAIGYQYFGEHAPTVAAAPTPARIVACRIVCVL